MLFFAYHRDEFIVCEPDLVRVLDLLCDMQDARQPEDAAVWCDGRLVVVRHADGRLTWLQPHFRPAAADPA